MNLPKHLKEATLTIGAFAAGAALLGGVLYGTVQANDTPVNASQPIWASDDPACEAELMYRAERYFDSMPNQPERQADLVNQWRLSNPACQ